MAKRSRLHRSSSMPAATPASAPAAPPVTPDASTPAPPNPNPAAVSDDPVARLSLPFDVKTGTIAFDRMRASTREQLKKALSDPKAREALGDGAASASSASSEENAAFNAMIVNVIYDAIGTLAVVMARSRGFSSDAAQVMRYTDDEKAAFMVPTLRVLNKYDLLGGKYADEIALVGLVGMTTAGHIMALQRSQPASVVNINRDKPEETA